MYSGSDCLGGAEEVSAQPRGQSPPVSVSHLTPDSVLPTDRRLKQHSDKWMDRFQPLNFNLPGFSYPGPI